ncbi:MAG: NADH-quinone oxidoreductase subunit A [Aeromicrobium sp.]|jgi:NADH-quinone oxidoreductase subunit A|nr:NADH-quinone oxidoreductase subunit A [Aeromicrobium sp.]
MASAESLLFVIGLALGPILFLVVMLGANAILAPKRPNDIKSSAYECGIEQASSPWKPVNIRFSTVALLFVIFDAETVLLFAAGTRIRGSVTDGLAVALFGAFLTLGLFYEWKKGGLKWPA